MFETLAEIILFCVPSVGRDVACTNRNVLTDSRGRRASMKEEKDVC